MHLIKVALALAAVAAITATVRASHHQTNTAEPFLADIRNIIKLAKTAEDPPPVADTPGFKCRSEHIYVLVCDFDTKPTFDQAKAIMAEFKTMGADPLVSTYREDNGTTYKFDDGKWGVGADTSYLPDVMIDCRLRTRARYNDVYFEFKSKK